MKIEKPGQDYNDRIQLESTKRTEEARSQAKAGATPRAGGSDQATVSDQARLLAKSRAEFDRVAEQRSDRVNRLHDQVSAGQYEVPYGALAARLSGKFKDTPPAA